MRIGFTGTRKGMTRPQHLRVASALLAHVLHSPTEIIGFHHGDCIGADEQASDLAAMFGYHIVIHPPVNESARAFCDRHTFPHYVYYSVLQPRQYLNRNRDIVDACDVLIAAPGEMTEAVRSGTWATIRYARASEKRMTIVYPNGKV